MKLSTQEKNSHTWVVIKAHLEERLSMLRRKNDNKLDDVSTEWLRGQIAEVKALLSIDKDEDIAEHP